MLGSQILPLAGSAPLALQRIMCIPYKAAFSNEIRRYIFNLSMAKFRIILVQYHNMRTNGFPYFMTYGVFRLYEKEVFEEICV